MRQVAVLFIAWCASTAVAAAAPPAVGPSPAPAATATAAPPTAPAAPAPPRPPAPRPTYQPVEFGRLVLKLNEGGSSNAGGSLMEVEVGPACVPIRRVTADGIQEDVKFPAAAARFREAITEAGLRPAVGADDDLFVPQADVSADYIVSGVIVYVHERVCLRSPYDTSLERGEFHMTIDWKLYSRSRGQVVASVRTVAHQYANQGQANGVEVLLGKAFAESVRRMAADPAIRRALAAEPAAAQQTAMLPAAQPPIQLAGSLAAAPHGLSTTADSVVLISLPNAFGSGFLVSKDGYLLTDAHVVEGAKTVKVRWSDGVEAEGVVVRLDRGRDVALVKTDPRGHAPLPLRKDAPEVGDTVFAIGAPLEKALQGTVMRGAISARRVQDGYDMLQSDVNVNHGMSGGPLLDEHGRVVALAESAKQLHYAVPEGINYFTPIGDALRYLSLTPQ